MALALVADRPAAREAASILFPDVPNCPVETADLRPGTPFEGPMFRVLTEQEPGVCVALVIPVVLVGAAVQTIEAPLIAVADHVNLTLRSPLCGRWPEGRPRAFPVTTGLYQPFVIRSRGGPRVYSSRVVAGVDDARRLTPFETGVVRDEGYQVVSDVLVPTAIMAAYYGLRLAACGVIQADDCDEE